MHQHITLDQLIGHQRTAPDQTHRSMASDKCWQTDLQQSVSLEVISDHKKIVTIAYFLTLFHDADLRITIESNNPSTA